MPKPKGRTNPVKLRQGMTIGSSNAESDDNYLFDCFVHYPPVEQCEDLDAPGMVIAGRTGSGKTAILRYIERTAERRVELDPLDMAMSYVSNSDALRFLQVIGADLDLLFQTLWKHVLCIEFIRLRYEVENEQKSRSVFDRLVSPFRRDERKRKAIQYLRDWEGRFWITMDQNIKEITETVENRLNAEFGAEIAKFTAGGQYEKRLSEERKSELVARSRKIINADQLAELAGVIDILKNEESNNRMNKYYILIDRLDERWVDVSVRFRLIRALIEALKPLRRIPTLKVLVAIRTDILERVVQETKDITFQREKFEDYFVRLKWSKGDLRDLVNRRIQLLFQRQYSGEQVWFDDIFRSKVGNLDPFDYIVERTLMRPRDIISFVNECLNCADGHFDVSASAIRRAEIEYSRKRRDALAQEWQSAFPSVRPVLDFIGNRRKVILNVHELSSSDDVDELATLIYTDYKSSLDPILDAAKRQFEVESATRLDFVREILAMLYRIGAVGLKVEEHVGYQYSHRDAPMISPETLGPNTRIRIHPMLHGVYRLHPSSGRGRRQKPGELSPGS